MMSQSACLSLGKARLNVTVAGERQKAGLSADEQQKTAAANTESAGTPAIRGRKPGNNSFVYPKDY